MDYPLELPQKPRMSPVQTEDGSWSYRTADGYVNPFTNTGIGTNNLSSGGQFILNPITRNRMKLEWAYRGNWVVRTIVDAPADDMTREGVEIQSTDDAKDIEKIHKEAQRLQIWTMWGKVIKWARLYGGALGFLMIDGQDPATPLDIDKVGKDQFKGILPLDRWMAWPDTGDIIAELSPAMNMPRMYTLWPDAASLTGTIKIHHSRVIKIDGLDIPYWQRIAENYWGLSVLEPIWDRIMAFDSATQGAAQLIYKAHLRVINVKNMRKLVGGNDVAAQALQKYFEYVRVYQSNEGMTLLDSEDTFTANSYSFAGLADMILQFAQQLGGSEQIPMVRFFGQSPSGMNATGESDWRNYYDGITARQERNMRPGVEIVYGLLYRSVLGRIPETLTLIFKSLWQMTEEENAKVVTAVTSAVATLVDKQIYTPSMALKELKTQAAVTGFGTNIEDKDIEAMEKVEKEAAENPPNQPGDPNTDPQDDPGSSGGPVHKVTVTTTGGSKSGNTEDSAGTGEGSDHHGITPIRSAA